METHAVFEIQVKSNGELAFNQLTDGAKKWHGQATITHKTTNDLTEAFHHLKTTLLEGATIMEAFSFGKEGEDMYLGIKRADAEIQASLKSTGAVAGVTAQQLQESSEALYHHSEYGTEKIKRMQSVLLTFPGITKATFNEAQQAITDMTAKLQGKDGDLQGLAIRVGKALQDPAHGMQLLAREGVNFTHAQVKMVEGMVASGHSLEAQRYVIHELGTEFGGSAQAALDAGGAHEQMAKTVEELKIQAGGLVNMLETDLVPIFSTVVGETQSLIKWGEEHKDLIEGTVKVVGALVGAYVTYTAVTKIAEGATLAFTAAQALMSGYTVAETAELIGLTTAEGAAAEGMTALDIAMDANPIGLVVTAVAALAAGLLYLANNMDIATDAKKRWDSEGKEAFNGMTPDQQAGQIGEITKKISLAQQDLKDEESNTGSFNMGGMDTSDAIKKQKALISELEKERKDMIAGALPQKSPTAKGGALTKSGTPSPDGKDSGKQIVNTWNIREFGKTTINAASVKDSTSDVHDHIMRALTTAVNDSEIASAE